MGWMEGNEPTQATAPRECGQWRGTSELRVGVRGLPAALAAYLNQKPSLTLGDLVSGLAQGRQKLADCGEKTRRSSLTPKTSQSVAR